jgi:argininosuccinate lyase
MRPQSQAPSERQIVAETHERLWGGRFAEAPDAATLRFMAGRDVTPSAPADAHLVAEDLWASAAHVAMLAQQGIIPPADARLLLEGLDELARRHEQGAFVLDPAREDVHTNIEMALAELCGPEAGGRVHTGRSRNDQVATAMRLYLRGRALDFAGATIDLARTIVDLAARHRETIMPGFSHHQPATPTTLGHVLASYAEAFERDAARLLAWLDLHNRSPLGGAAGYGTTVPLDRALTAGYLAFDGPHLTSLDPLTARGEPETDLALALAALLKHLASLAQTLILLGSPGYGLLRLSPAYCSGSSIMPQKGNPCTMEAMKAKAAVAGGLVAGLLGVGAAAFMGYNRDTQWSKYLIVDLVEEARDAAAVMAGALSTMHVDVARAAELAAGYFVGSTALMEWLVTAHGLPLRRAKRVVETAVRLSEEGGAGEVTAPALRAALDEHGIALEIEDAQVAAVQRPEAIVRAARTAGGPAPEAVDAAIAGLQERLDAGAATLEAFHERIKTARARLRAAAAAFTAQ